MLLSFLRLVYPLMHLVGCCCLLKKQILVAVAPKDKYGQLWTTSCLTCVPSSAQNSSKSFDWGNHVCIFDKIASVLKDWHYLTVGLFLARYELCFHQVPPKTGTPTFDMYFDCKNNRPNCNMLRASKRHWNAGKPRRRQWNSSPPKRCCEQFWPIINYMKGYAKYKSAVNLCCHATCCIFCYIFDATSLNV